MDPAQTGASPKHRQPGKSGMARMGRVPGGAVVRQLLMGFTAGLTAMGIVNLLRWLREPVLRR